MDLSYDLIATPATTLLAILCAGTAAVVDHRHGLIPNALTYPCLLGGMALATIAGGWAGLGLSVAGILAGGSVFLLAFMIGSCGGGDVKLMAALGAILGAPAALDLTLASLLVGGAMAVALMLRRLDPADMLARIRLFVMLAPAGIRKTGPALKPGARHTLRFGVAVALGLAWLLLLPSLSPLSLSL